MTLFVQKEAESLERLVSYLVEIKLQRGSMIYLYYIYFYMDTLLASPQYSPDIGTS